MVRKAAGIDFPGLDASVSFIIAEAQMTETPPIGVRPEGGGIGPVDPQSGGGPYRLALKEERVDHSTDPTIEDVRATLVRACGTDFGAHSPTWISRFTDSTRQAASYRNGRVLLAGDAAHIHFPMGGQGLNIGVQDAVNLGWKLAQVVHGTSPATLLDTYHAERHPVGARVLRNTMAQVALTTADDRHPALHETMTELLAMDEPRRRIAGMLSGLDVHYDLGEGHPLLGRRMPDLDLVTADGPTRVFALLHEVRPVLLNLGEPGGFDVSPWADRVRLVEAVYDGVWELPVLGKVAAPEAVLIRPDGHVVWTGVLTDPELPRRSPPGSAPRSPDSAEEVGGTAAPVRCTHAPNLRLGARRHRFGAPMPRTVRSGDAAVSSRWSSARRGGRVRRAWFVPAELAGEEDHGASLGVALDDVDEAAGHGDDVARADGLEVAVALAAVEQALAGLGAHAPEPVAGPGAVGHPGERVEVARRHDAAPRAARPRRRRRGSWRAGARASRWRWPSGRCRWRPPAARPPAGGCDRSCRSCPGRGTCPAQPRRTARGSGRVRRHGGLPSSKSTTVAEPGVVSTSSWFVTDRSERWWSQPVDSAPRWSVAVQVSVSPFMLRPRNSQRNSTMSPGVAEPVGSRLWR